jgi:hypothetical protein
MDYPQQAGVPKVANASSIFTSYRIALLRPDIYLRDSRRDRCLDEL